MGTVDDMIDRMIQDRRQPDSRVVQCQTKLSSSQSDLLDEYVAYWQRNGVPHMTRSSAIRAMITAGLQPYAQARRRKAM